MVEVKLNCDSDYKYLVDSQEERIKSRYKFVYDFMTEHLVLGRRPNTNEPISVGHYVSFS